MLDCVLSIQNSTPLVGIDLGSTTAKLVLVEQGRVTWCRYERHLSKVREAVLLLLEQLKDRLGERPFRAALSGSAGLGLSQQAGLPFVQEVFATSRAVSELAPDTDVVIELGGEDAKVLFLTGGADQRMNGTCAGGTGAFIDQMATLLGVTVEQLDRLSLSHRQIYPIASRCGVFAKSDIQPLLNQGARKEDLAASIYQAVVNQTITGLAQGRPISGRVMFLGGPLYYCQGLRERFVQTLGLSPQDALFPEYSRFAVAIGAALCAQGERELFTCDTLTSLLQEAAGTAETPRLAPLFDSREEYDEFCARHARACLPRAAQGYRGDAYLGIDCGSTTTKLALLTPQGELLYSDYQSNHGSPIEVVRGQLEDIYRTFGDRVRICGSAATGYGEQLIRDAFHVGCGLVETMAHLLSAQFFCPEVDFILDIGGQDIKCFTIRDGAIDGISLNEACSSGCGSFLETFATSMGLSVADFAREGLFARAPVDLGSRCTVFMNSSVKQAQKEGASLADISAGLSISVVKNALYKVIRAGSPPVLGRHVVAQGGTFLNDAVLRAFERELGQPVLRPDVAGLMGAVGAALYALRHPCDTLLDAQALGGFSYQASSTQCKGCANRCALTVIRFADGRRSISGNRCERALGQSSSQPLPNLYAFKRERLLRLKPQEGRRGVIGIPLALGAWELAPLWHALFSQLGFSVVLSPPSTRATYEKGQSSIPSDTVCYPAKLMHGHIEELLEQKPDFIFCPCLTYNFEEKGSDNHYNCPVVAYYPELLHGNMPHLRQTTFLYPYLNLNSRHQLARELRAMFLRCGISLPGALMHRAVERGFEAYRAFQEELAREGEKALSFARETGRRVMILAGRPYHADPEISHGIDELAASLGFVVVSEDSVFHLAPPQPVAVLNQWTYHARLYRAAAFAAATPGVELVQLVSFGCGIDAITTDEVRSILTAGGKIYTGIKIDEITNLGAVRIRLRSLLAALEERGEPHVQ